MSGRRGAVAGVVLVVAGIALIGASAVLGSSPRTGESGGLGGMMAGNGMAGMMAGYSSRPSDGPQPGQAGFVAGTPNAPRVINVFAGPGYVFTPATVTVQRGETISFAVTTMGPFVHEFMVGPADAVAADQEGTPEVTDIGMMETKTLTYTFDGAGPYAFACHEPGHFEAGMRGTITVAG